MEENNLTLKISEMITFGFIGLISRERNKNIKLVWFLFIAFNVVNTQKWITLGEEYT